MSDNSDWPFFWSLKIFFSARDKAKYYPYNGRLYIRTIDKLLLKTDKNPGVFGLANCGDLIILI